MGGRARARGDAHSAGGAWRPVWEIPQDGPVYLICRSGARSNRAAHALAGAGWDALNVADGMQGWAAQAAR